MEPHYRFTLSAGNTPRTVYPIYKSDLAINYEREREQQFFRGKLNGKLTFVGQDYSYILSKSINTEFIIKIALSYDGEAFSDYWQGHFWKTDCEVDEDAGTVVVEPDVLDRYTAILKGWNKEYDLIGLAPEIVPVKMDKRPMVQVYVPGQSVVGCFLSGMWWEEECTVVENTNTLTSKYFFGLLKSQRIIEVTQEGEPILPKSFIGEPWASGYTDKSYESGDYRFLYTYYGGSTGQRMSWQIQRISDGVILWSYELINEDTPGSIPYTVTLQPVPGTGASGEVSLYIHDISVYARWVSDLEKWPGMETATHEIPSDDMVDKNRNYTRCVPYDLPNSVVFFDYFTNTPTKWGIYQPGVYYESPAGTSLAYYGDAYPIAPNVWNLYSLWFVPKLYDYGLLEEAWRSPITMKHGYPLYSAISVLLNKIGAGAEYGSSSEYSQFLNGENPLTGITSTLVITPKSNIISSYYDQPAQKGKITLKKILEMLRDCFRCYWFIDNDGRLRIEHISWFMKGETYDGEPSIGIDLTTMYVPRNGKTWDYARKQYSYEKPDMPQRYQFSWMDDATEPFEGWPLEMISPYVSDNNEDISIANFSTDVDYILLNPNGISKDGFALLGAVSGEKGLELPYWNYIYNQTDHFLQNGYLSWYYLARFYYPYDLPAARYSLHDVIYNAEGMKRLKKQEIDFPIIEEPDFMELVKTSLGSASISKISLNLASRNANATLLYDTD